MNRLIIVGNGFDLAHGLPTGYHHFIDWYWKNILGQIQNLTNKIYNDTYISIDYNFVFQSQTNNDAKNNLTKITNYCSLIAFIKEYNTKIYRNPNHKRFSLKFHNTFLETICNKHSIQNWVDIEDEYYQLLKGCLKENSNAKVKKLNKEFEQVKSLLHEYLLSCTTDKFNFEKISNNFDELTKHFRVTYKHLDNESEYLQEFPKQDYIELIEKDKQIKELYYNKSLLQHEIWDGKIHEENLFLNFNYTSSLNKYINFMGSSNTKYPYGKAELIQIHGRLNDPDNKINFGFGDEMDKHYQEIEEKDDNEYLKNIKSFQYLQNSNYKKVLDFIDSNKFQVYIMGHSCGLSDRILLNTIFEHDNCRSIKVFYHQKEDSSDNYTEIVQNISRHFNKKKMMRDKIVNKSLCSPLPQTIRFEAKP